MPVAEPVLRVGREAEAGQRLELLPVGLPGRAARRERLVGDEGERAGGGDAPVELPERAGRRVAGIREEWRALAIEQAVHGLEVLLLEEHLAADLEARRRVAAQPLEHAGIRSQSPHRPEVGGHVLAHRPVAARRAHGQIPVPVDELHGEPVELGLADVLDRRVRGDVEHPVNPDVELVEFLVAGHVAEREHGLAVLDLGELLARLPRDAAGGRVGRGQLRVGLLQREEVAHEPVVLGVGEDGAVENVVGAVRLADPRLQFIDALRRAASHAPSVTPAGARRQPVRRDPSASEDVGIGGPWIHQHERVSEALVGLHLACCGRVTVDVALAGSPAAASGRGVVHEP